MQSSTACQEWTTEHVCKWITQEGMGNYATIFREQQVDGRALVCIVRAVELAISMVLTNKRGCSNRTKGNGACCFAIVLSGGGGRWAGECQRCLLSSEDYRKTAEVLHGRILVNRPTEIDGQSTTADDGQPTPVVCYQQQSLVGQCYEPNTLF